MPQTDRKAEKMKGRRQSIVEERKVKEEHINQKKGTEKRSKHLKLKNCAVSCIQQKLGKKSDSQRPMLATHRHKQKATEGKDLMQANKTIFKLLVIDLKLVTKNFKVLLF